MICNFANGTCHGRGALGCFDILVGTSTQYSTKTKSNTNIMGFPWHQHVHTLDFQLLPIFLMVLACEMSNPGRGVEYDMV